MPTQKKPTHPRFKSLPQSISDLSSTLFPNAKASVAILALTDSNIQTKYTKKQWLHKKELLKLSNFTYKKRYREWIGGRICSKQSLLAYFEQQHISSNIPEHHCYRICSEKSGRPYFSGLNNTISKSPDLSISHSKNYAAALVSAVHCGIDIQYSADNLPRVQDRFSIKNELLLLKQKLSHLSTLQHLTLLWAGKEAVKKMLSHEGMPGFQELTLNAVSVYDSSTASLHFTKDNGNTYAAVVGIFDNHYALALCCETDNHSTPNQHHA